MSSTKKIGIISEGKGFSVISLKEKFESKDYEVCLSDAKLNEIATLPKELNAILIYLSADVASNLQVLTYIKDMAVENDIYLFIEGNPEEIEKAEAVLPKHLLRPAILRPVDATEVCERIDEFVSTEAANVKKKILVIDDSGAMLRMVKGWLEHKYQVILANSGMMGIKYLSQNRPDLILLDYEMPVCDGKQVLEMIRSDAEVADVPVIFLTGKDDKESVLQVMSLKPEGYLLKSSPEAEIVSAVDNFFLRQKQKML